MHPDKEIWSTTSAEVTDGPGKLQSQGVTQGALIRTEQVRMA